MAKHEKEAHTRHGPVHQQRGLDARGHQIAQQGVDDQNPAKDLLQEAGGSHAIGISACKGEGRKTED